MTTIRPARRRKYTSISRDALNDQRLSFRARGVLAWLLDKPDDWSTDSEQIAQAGTEGRDAIRTALRELQTFGYLRRSKRQQDGTGRWLTETLIYETPELSPATENPLPVPGPENPSSAPATENPTPGIPTVGKSGANTKTVTEDCKTKDSSRRRSGSERIGGTWDHARRLCDLLADLMVGNGCKRPTVGDGWLDELERLIRIDERSPEQVETMIRWSQQDSFWKTNIHSPAALRKQFDRMRLKRNDQIAVSHRGPRATSFSEHAPTGEILV